MTELEWNLVWYTQLFCLTLCAWSHRVRQSRKTDEEHEEHCAEKRFQLAKVKFDREGENDREALGMGYCSINI